MDDLNYTKNYLDKSFKVKQGLMDDHNLISSVINTANVIKEVYASGNKVLIAGNGGSAADSQHIAAELVSRFLYDRPGLPAIALTTDSSMLTAIGNDYGFKRLFSRQVQAQGIEGDIFIGISTSGNSENIIEAVKEAKKKNIYTVALCGNKGVLKDLADTSIEVPSSSTPHIQECHILIGHIICALVEKNIFPKED